MNQLSFVSERTDSSLVKESVERLYEVEGDVSNLNLSELLCLMIGTGTKKTSLQQMVNQILDMKREYGLKGLTVERVMTIEGFTKRKAEMFIAALELGRRVYNEKAESRYVIRSPKDAADFLEYLKDYNQEHFVALFLNTKNEVLLKKTIFKGSLNASIVHPREIFNEALMRSAASVIVAHNHPSGHSAPSREDIEVTKRLVEVGKIVGIEVLDHVIVAANDFTSIKEKGHV
ncbi:RadC family protein [Metabacillus endolithicus]|uniref:DNA repair protein RadC n=1 Tax=Metabacillus endolithicus TaxID=1535204 RepID=A0ABW5C5L6_9BACI